MKWCCVGFKGNYEMAGQRGPSILVGRDSLGMPEVTLQCRVVDRGQESSIKSDNYPVSIVTDIRIVFCPWCGRNVEEWYRREIDALFRPHLKISS
jgi:hypothetical protein